MLAGALTLLTAATALAQPSGARPEAKRLKDLGASALERGDYALALESFEQAYRTFPSPRLRYNLGLALGGVGRYPEAIEAFEAFLAEAADAPADARAYARRRAVELEGRVGRLEIVTADGAALFVDGKPVGAAPMAGAVRVLPGAHQIHAELAGHA